MPTETQATSTPPTLGRYELLMQVARGGMGQVWAARLRGARGFNKLVALKTVLPIAGSEGRLENMLLEEARIAALIHHPNVVQTIELGEHDHQLYLVMEWVDGEPLSYVLERALERGPFPLPIAVNLVSQTLLGLHAAHELTDDAGVPLGVVHRDVSPHNVLVTYSGVAKLVDFGIAKAMNQDSSSTQTGEVKGKFSYMAPEQIRCAPVDRRADLFAMGILLYTLTTGRHPFKSDNPAGVVHKIASDDPPARPSLLVSGYSRTLEAVVMKALEKDPDARWQSASEMLAGLQQAFPAAFVAGFESEIRDFMTGLFAQRASLRREAVRRAQLAADARSPSGSLPAVSQAPSQSASSLRAMSIDQTPSEEPPPTTSPGDAELQPAVTHLPAPARRMWAVGFALAVVLTGALVLFRTVGGHGVSARSTAMSADAPSVPVQEQRNGLSAPSASIAAPSASAPEIGTVAAPADSTGPAPALEAAPVAPKPAARTNAKGRPSRPKSRDLIAPDYAR